MCAFKALLILTTIVTASKHTKIHNICQSPHLSVEISQSIALFIEYWVLQVVLLCHIPQGHLLVAALFSTASQFIKCTQIEHNGISHVFARVALNQGL